MIFICRRGGSTLADSRRSAAGAFSRHRHGDGHGRRHLHLGLGDEAVRQGVGGEDVVGGGGAFVGELLQLLHIQPVLLQVARRSRRSGSGGMRNATASLTGPAAG